MQFLVSISKLPFKDDADFVCIDKCGYHIYLSRARLSEFASDIGHIYVIGDCINCNQFDWNGFTFDKIRQLQGLFYLIVIRENSFEIASGNFGMLPVYYKEDFSIVSNSIQQIKKYSSNQLVINKRFILETYLFNYAFSDQTYLTSVRLLRAFSLLEFGKTIRITDYDAVSEWFVEKPKCGKKVLEELAIVFLDQVKHYFPDKGSSITFTGGFDGRSLVAAALKHNKKFSTFSFGKLENDDVYIPKDAAKKLDIPYKYYDLGNSEFIEIGGELSINICKAMGGYNGFLSSPTYYGVIKESKVNDYLITGYCGSELFRALHIQGSVTSKELMYLFNERNDNVLKDSLWNSNRLMFLNKNLFKDAFDDMFHELLQFRNNISNKNQNHSFYIYIFNEVFRKVFGILANFQFDKMIVRIPYLDYYFVRQLLITEFAGCNNDFFTHNPFKRFKGQLLYAEILKRSNSELFSIETDKGYAPKDLLNSLGNINIIYSYFLKRLKRKIKKQSFDNLGLISSFHSVKDEMFKTMQPTYLFNFDLLLNQSTELSEYTPEEIRNNIFQTVTFLNILV